MIDSEVPSLSAESLKRRPSSALSCDNALRVFIAKKADEGEDAPPLVHVCSHMGLVGVADGLGGSGSMQYNFIEDSHSAAYFASRIVLNSLKESATFHLSLAPSDIGRRLHSALDRFDEACGRPRLAVRSRTMIRVLPTTLAFGVVRTPSSAGQPTRLDIAWSGDSRIWFLSAGGLRQLSRDDVIGNGDPLQNLISDARMSQCICLDRPYKLNSRSFHLKEPGMLLAGTDGCFQYLRSPMHFEGILLEELTKSVSFDDWSKRLTARLSDAGDDVSLAGLLVGPQIGFAALQRRLSDRAHVVCKTWIEPLNQLIDTPESGFSVEDRDSDIASKREELWMTYKGLYMSASPLLEIK